MSMNVPTVMLAVSISASTQEVPIGVNAIVAMTSRLIRRVARLVSE